jgi:MFS family permease
LTAASGPTPRALFTFLIAAQAVFGFGVGGEFPVASSSASEKSEGSPGGSEAGKRGETVVLVFSMQVSILC